ncbi:FAD-dependent monooxygenase [Sinomonas atrocyanea]|uniref:FAD-dependent monooxygenase n=1 Tax=Sinomonas atrocyanea TaxID=37927 RepID=UPI003D98ABAD
MTEPLPASESVDVDVVVLGAGPTGLTAACLMADAGLSVAVVEQHPGTGDEPRAISATDEALRIMQQLGVLPGLAPETLLGTGARYTGRRRQVLADVRPPRPRLGQPGKSQFDQPVMEGLLWEAAAARPGIQLHFGTEATRLAQTHDGVELTGVRRGPRSQGYRGDLAQDEAFALADAGTGDVVHQGGTTASADAGAPPTEVTFRSQWLVACDGGRSFARKALGIGLEGSTQVEKWIVVDLLDAGEGEPYASFHCNGSRPAVVVPGVKGRRRYEFMLLPGEDEATMVSPASIRALVGEYQGVERLRVRRAAVYTAQQRLASRWREGRVLLAGDAAHLMPPFAGQGLNAGLRDAAAAAWRVAEAVHGRAGDGLMDSYEAERKPHAAEMVRLSKRIGAVVMSTNPLVCALRDAAIPALGVAPRVKAWLTTMKFLRQPRYHRGLAVPVARDVPGPAADLLGRALPQPDVVPAEGGAVVKLDDVLGRGFAWVAVLGPGELSVTRPGEAPEAVRTVAGAVDAGILDAAEGHELLVRPDRYTAAVVPIGARRGAYASLADALPGLADQFAVPSGSHLLGVNS